jgi:hypothetical protein
MKAEFSPAQSGAAVDDEAFVAETEWLEDVLVHRDELVERIETQPFSVSERPDVNPSRRRTHQLPQFFTV